MNKKADVGVGTILLVVIIVLALGWLVNEGWKECRTDADCGSDEYCGSDFECHKHQIVQQSPQGLNAAAWILGISLIIAALIMKWDKIFSKKRKDRSEEDQKSHSYNAEEEGLYDKELES